MKDNPPGYTYPNTCRCCCHWRDLHHDCSLYDNMDEDGVCDAWESNI
jgi:hypothetical protein